MKTLKSTVKQDKEKFIKPKMVQQIIPIQRVYEDGIFQLSKTKFSKMYQFDDVNYEVASPDDQTAIFLEYCELLNSLDCETTTKITINNRRVNKKRIAGSLLIGNKYDGLDEYRAEYNQILMDKAAGSDAMIQDKYVTLSVHRNSIEDARSYFMRAGANLSVSVTDARFFLSNTLIISERI